MNIDVDQYIVVPNHTFETTYTLSTITVVFPFPYPIADYNRHLSLAGLKITIGNLLAFGLFQSGSSFTDTSHLLYLYMNLPVHIVKAAISMLIVPTSTTYIWVYPKSTFVIK